MIHGCFLGIERLNKMTEQRKGARKGREKERPRERTPTQHLHEN